MIKLREFNNLKELQSFLKSKINKSLIENVSPVVKETMHDSVDSIVYLEYSPVVYERRMDKGGLSDISIMDDELISDGVLSVSNGQPDSLVETVITGEGYTYHPWNGTRGAYEKPRDFISNTVETLKKTKRHVNALRDGLKKQGINVK